MLITFTYLYIFILAMILIKELFWKILGLTMGMKAIEVTDEFLLYDLPVNPDIITTCIILEGIPDKKTYGDSEEIYENLFKKLLLIDNFGSKITKFLGKYYLKK